MTGRKTALTYAGAESKFGITCENATPSEAKQTTPATTNTTSSIGSFNPSTPKKALPATSTMATCSSVLVTAFAATPPR